MPFGSRICTFIFIACTCSFCVMQTDTPSQSGDARDASALRLVTIGERTLSTGRRGGFRVYQTPDKVQATVSYAHFATIADATRQINEWRALIKDKSDHINASPVRADDRLTGWRQEASKIKEFLILRRDGLECFLIQSPSASAALDVESLIQDADPAD